MVSPDYGRVKRWRCNGTTYDLTASISADESTAVWKLTVHEDRTAALVCGDGNDHIVYAKHIPFTDFPVDEITLWFANNTIYLPLASIDAPCHAPATTGAGVGRSSLESRHGKSRRLR